MRRLCLTASLVLSFAAAPMAHAASACHIQGQIGGHLIDECTQSSQPIADAQMQAQCNGKVPGLEAVGGQATAKAVAACPGGAQGVCDSPMGAQAKIHYYQRDAAQLEVIQRSCESQRGRWIKP